nr:hypothetical protein [uncultured bacterium]
MSTISFSNLFSSTLVNLAIPIFFYGWSLTFCAAFGFKNTLSKHYFFRIYFLFS